MAYRISRCFQSCYEKFTVVVAGWCKSAGTLICIGASEIVMGDMGELGPLDVQLAKPDELGTIASGLTIDSSFRSLQAAAFQMFERCLLDILAKSGGRITTKTAAELSVNLSVGLFAPIYGQMDPAKIGEDYRSTRIAEEYAHRLNVRPQNLSFDNEGDPVESLVRGYPSHGFVIDRTEAMTLCRRVTTLHGHLQELVNALGQMSFRPQSDDQPIAIYLSQEKKNGHESELGGSHGKTSIVSGEKPGDPAGGSLQTNFAASDRIVTLPVTDRKKRARGDDA